MALEPLAQLKLNLREDETAPFFAEGELENLLVQCKNNVQKASYRGWLMKAENDSISLPGGMKTPDNSKYCKGMAKIFRRNATVFVKRADEL